MTGDSPDAPDAPDGSDSPDAPDAPDGSARLGRIDVLTVFPRYLEPLEESLLGKAVANGLLRIGVHDLRRWTDDVHRTVDDSPYGGGPGMVMRPEPWGRAISEIVMSDVAYPRTRPVLVLPTPAGRPFTHALASEYARCRWLVIACGRYEGIDARVAAWASRHMRVDEVSIGDYVLSGGEVAAMVIVEAVTRLVPGFMGNEASAAQDSFSDGLLEGPAFTRPETWEGLGVPEVLRSGNHARVARWRREESLRRTVQRRPDLLTAELVASLDGRDRDVLRAEGLRLPPESLAHWKTGAGPPAGDAGASTPAMRSATATSTAGETTRQEESDCHEPPRQH